MVIQNFFMLKFMFFTDKQCSHSLMGVFLQTVFIRNISGKYHLLTIRFLIISKGD